MSAPIIEVRRKLAQIANNDYRGLPWLDLKLPAYMEDRGIITAVFRRKNRKCPWKFIGWDE